MKLGIDIGGSHLGIGLVDQHGNIAKKIEINENMKTKNSADILNYIEKAALDIQKEASIEMIGIGVPGNVVGSKVTNIVNIGSSEIDFEPLKEKFHSIPLRIMNDAKAAALGEKEYGAMQNYRDAVYLCFGTGIGGAVFMDGKLLQPKRNDGFEVGHMIIQKNGKRCSCGKQGCFETYCSIKKFKTEVTQELKQMGITHLEIPQDFMQNLELNQKEHNIATIINEYIENLVVGISNIIDIFEPEVICFGGSFVYYKEILFNEAIKRLKESKYVFNKNSFPEFTLAQLKNDAGIIGATVSL